MLGVARGRSSPGRRRCLPTFLLGGLLLSCVLASLLLLRVGPAGGSPRAPGAAARRLGGAAPDAGRGARWLVAATSSCEDVAPPAAWLWPRGGGDAAASAAEAAAFASYDVLLFDYSVNGSCARYTPASTPGGRFTRLHTPRAYKWPAMHAHFSSPAGRAALARYERFLLSDDDVVFHGGAAGVARLLALSAAAALHIAQPALSPGSAMSFAATAYMPHEAGGEAAEARSATAYVRLTGFVEQMSPVFSAEALAQFLPHFANLTHAWGIDLLWSDVSVRLGARVGVVDSVVIDHARPSGVSGLYARVGGIERARAEQAAFRARHGISDAVVAAAHASGGGAVVTVNNVLAVA